jgi:hypothetical protein
VLDVGAYEHAIEKNQNGDVRLIELLLPIPSTRKTLGQGYFAVRLDAGLLAVGTGED